MKGKFNSISDQAVYELSLDGADETVGSVQTIGAVWSRVAVPEAFDYEIPFTGISRVHAGTYIVEEDAQGFVSVTGYDDADKLETDWARIVEEVAQFEDEDDEQ